MNLKEHLNLSFYFKTKAEQAPKILYMFHIQTMANRYAELGSVRF
jgi:hypothetical protein